MDDLVNDSMEKIIKQEQIEIICNYNYALNEEFEYLDKEEDSGVDEEIKDNAN